MISNPLALVACWLQNQQGRDFTRHLMVSMYFSVDISTANPAFAGLVTCKHPICQIILW